MSRRLAKHSRCSCKLLRPYIQRNQIHHKYRHHHYHLSNCHRSHSHITRIDMKQNLQCLHLRHNCRHLLQYSPHIRKTHHPLLLPHRSCLLLHPCIRHNSYSHIDLAATHSHHNCKLCQTCNRCKIQIHSFHQMSSPKNQSCKQMQSCILGIHSFHYQL